MVLTKDEILVLVKYYEDLIGHIDRRIDDIENSEASKLLDHDIFEKQIDRLIDDRKVYENRLETLKAATDLF